MKGQANVLPVSPQKEKGLLVIWRSNQELSALSQVVCWAFTKEPEKEKRKFAWNIKKVHAITRDGKRKKERNHEKLNCTINLLHSLFPLPSWKKHEEWMMLSNYFPQLLLGGLCFVWCNKPKYICIKLNWKTL